MIPIKDLITAPDEILDFIEDYIDSIKSFRFTIETYKIERNILAIRNMDLWIESYIDIIPELQEFRDFVWKEMERLGIERHPDYVYDKDFNHFYCNNKRSIESLRELRDRLFNNEIEITRCVNHDQESINQHIFNHKGEVQYTTAGMDCVHFTNPKKPDVK